MTIRTLKIQNKEIYKKLNLEIEKHKAIARKKAEPILHHMKS